MGKEQEPTSHELVTNGEIPVTDKLRHEWTVEGLVVHVSDTQTKYVVTKILEGYEKLLESWYRPLHSPLSSLVFSHENIVQSSYRSLVQPSRYTSATDPDHYELDALMEHDARRKVGDRIKIARWSHIVPLKNHKDGWKYIPIEQIEVLETGINIVEEETAVRTKKERIRRGFAGIIRRIEELDMQRYARLMVDQPTTVQWRPSEKQHAFSAEYVFGHGDIEDHYVTIEATPYRHIGEAETNLAGETRYTQSGRMIVQRDIRAGTSEAGALERYEDMMTVSVTMSSETKLNTAVSSAQVTIFFDDKQYQGVLDVEQSTHYFDRPGHHIHFNDFLTPGDDPDALEVSEEDRDALNRYSGVIHDISMHMVHAKLNLDIRRKIDNQLPAPRSRDEMVRQAHNTEQLIELSPELIALREALTEVRLDAYEAVRPIVQRLRAAPNNLRIGFGGKLLVPKSQLHLVRVQLSQRDQLDIKD